MQTKGEQVQSEMRALVMEHAELLDALTEFDTARQRYDAERERRCAGRLQWYR
jgi:hypothetical protein